MKRFTPATCLSFVICLLLAGPVMGQAGGEGDAPASPPPEESTPEEVRAELLEAQNTEIGSLYGEGKYQEGVDAARRYLEEWAQSQGTDSAEYCSMYSNLGPLLNMLGDTQAASGAYRQALDCLRETVGAESEDMASALNNYGMYLGNAADFARAELALVESIRLLRAHLGENHFYVAITLNNLGMNQQNQGNLAAAQPTLQDAVARLRISLGNEHPTTATAINNLGRLLSARGDHEAAEPLLREALKIREEQLGPNHRDTLIGRRDLGRMLRRRGEFPAAEKFHRQALASFIATFDEEHPDVAMTHHELGRVLMEMGRHEEARSEMNRALVVYQGAYEAGHSSQVQLNREIGEIDFAQGRIEAARARFVAATEAFEIGRVRSGEGLSRATYLDSPWLALAVTELELGHEQQAWQALETAHGRVLEELLDTASQPASQSSQMAEATAMVGWLDLDMGGEMRSWAWSRRHDGVRWHQLKAGGNGDSQLAKFRQAVAEPSGQGALRKLASRVWQERFDPLTADLQDVQHVVVVPAGAMLGVPIGALRDDQGRWLSDTWTISYAPSADVYHWLRERSPATSDGGLFVGDPVLADATAPVRSSRRPIDTAILGAVRGLPEAIASLPPLPGTRAEVEKLSAGWNPRTVLLGSEASEDALVALAQTDQLKQFEVLHFATHALVDAEDADASALVLSQFELPAALDVLESGDRLLDGLVTSREIASEWSLDAELVTLSACNSALGRAVTGEGHVGFAYAFLQAGARSVLVSQWSVPDQATALFMGRFYRAWHHEGLTRAAALAAAQAALRDHRDGDGRRLYDHPYYWAPFVLVGDDR